MTEDLKQLLESVSQGDETATRKLLGFFQEKTLTIEEQEQIHIYLKAQKNHHAIYVRGLLYAFGYGIKQDYAMSFLLAREAAAKGNANAIYEVGRHYLEGLGVEKNYGNAMEWLNTAAGSPYYIADAMFDLGRVYEQGLGVEIDFAQAQQWYEKAAAKGRVK